MYIHSIHIYIYEYEHIHICIRVYIYFWMYTEICVMEWSCAHRLLQRGLSVHEFHWTPHVCACVRAFPKEPYIKSKRALYSIKRVPHYLKRTSEDAFPSAPVYWVPAFKSPPERAPHSIKNSPLFRQNTTTLSQANLRRWVPLSTCILGSHIPEPSRKSPTFH